MAFKHKKKPGARQYHNYSKEKLQSAINRIRNGAGIRETSKKYGIPKSTLSRKVRNLNPGSYGRPKALSKSEIKYLREGLLEYAKWACPLTRGDVQEIVEHYLNERSRVETRFKNNKPSSAWVKNFIKNDPELSERLAENVTRARISLTPEIVNEFFDNLEERLRSVDPKFIINYDETCMVDDPGREVVIVSRREKHAKKIMDSSKSGTSVMFAATASGTLLPPYICYKAKNTYPTWRENGPKGAGYDCSPSGWFNAQIFENWFRHTIIPYCRRLDPQSTQKKVIIGDNLASHTSLPVLALCKKYNIQFVLLPPNSTGDTQPLDVGYFRGLKAVWRKIVQQWKEKYKGAIPKEKFPRLLLKTLSELEKDGRSVQNIHGGFRGAGIFPVNREEVLKKIPRSDDTNDTGTNIQESWTKAFSVPLEKRRAQAYVRRKRTLRTAPGNDLVQTLTEEEKEELEMLELEENASAEDSDSGEDGVNTNEGALTAESSSTSSDSDSDADSDADAGSNEPETEVVNEPCAVEAGEFAIGKMIYNFGTTKECERRFVGQVCRTKCGRLADQFEISFLRKKRTLDSNGDAVYHFEFPCIEDKWMVTEDQLIQKVELLKTARGKFYFLDVPYDDIE